MSVRDLEIIVVCDHANINGGQAKVAVESAIGLARAGVHVRYVAATRAVDARLADAGVDVLAPDDEPGALDVIWNGAAARRLSGALNDAGPRTIVHVHGFAGAHSSAIGMPLSRRRLPVVATLHDYSWFCPTGTLYDFGAQVICSRRPMSGGCLAAACHHRSALHKAARVGRFALYAGALRGAITDMVTLSDLQENAVRHYAPPGVRFHRVINPIDVVQAPPAPIPHDAPFVYAGRLAPEKGAALFCEAARMAGVPALVIGDGPDRAALEAAFPEATFARWRKPAEVMQTMRSGARALVVPSRWYEGSPLNVMEALASGLPVVVSDACAGREPVRHGETGLIFKSGDVEALAAALRALQDDAVVHRLGAAAHARYWADPPTLERHVNRLIEVYETMLARRTGTQPSASAAPQ